MSAVETTINASEFAGWCGPAALSAVLPHRLTRETAAHLLLGIMTHRGHITAPHTDTNDMVVALSILGVDVELFDERTSTRIETAPQCLDRARRSFPTMHAKARAIIASAPAAEQSGLRELWLRMRRSRWAELAPTRAQNAIVRDWLLQPDTWLLVVEDDLDLHWLALRDHKIIAGEQTGRDYAGRHVIDALHVLDKRSDECLN